MSILRRYFRTGCIYFVTNVTYKREPILGDDVDLVLAAIDHVRKETGLVALAWVVLPDHLHMLVDPNDADLSSIMQKIKLSFSGRYRHRHSWHTGRLWQLRFWDHVIRDESDLSRHVDYIHYNPVKHGLVSSPLEYPHSSFHEYLRGGHYASDWGSKEEIRFGSGFGE